MILLILCASALAAEPSAVTRTTDLIDSLKAGDKVDGWPKMGPLKTWHLSMNTYADDLESTAIRDLYYRTCKKLDALYGDEVVSYRWKDGLGYPGQVTVVQFKNEVRGDSYLVAGVFEGNDSDSFWFSYAEGVLDVRGKTKRGDWQLDRILRCNWKQAEDRETAPGPKEEAPR